MKSFIRHSFFIGLFFLMASCGALKQGPRYPVEVDAAMQKEFNAAESAYRKQDWPTALALYKKYRESHESNKLADEATYKMGKVYFLQQNWKQAVATWVELTKTSPDATYRSKGNLMAAYAAVKNQDNTSANLYLEKVDDRILPAKLKLRLYWLAVAVGEAIGSPKSDQDYSFLRMADVYHASSDPAMEELGSEDLYSKRDVQQKLESWVVTPISADRIPAWMKNYPSGYSKPYVEYKLGKMYYEAGDHSKAREQLSRYVKSYPTHNYVTSANRLLTELGGAVDTAGSSSGIKVGVLLPLSGPQATFGEAVLRGIRCGAGQMNGCAVGQNKIELVVKDSGSDPEAIVGLVNQLEEEGAEAIVGPMSATLAQKAAERAGQSKIVLFPITQKSGIMQAGEYIFQLGFPTDVQTQALVKEALSHGLKRLAVFYPQNPYGQEMADLFTKEVAAQGGKLIVSQGYNPDGANMMEAIRGMKMHITHFSQTNGPNFDALFIPDTYARINAIALQLQEGGIEGIPLIGPNTWDDAKLGTEFLEKFPNSFFVDLFFAGAQTKASLQFINAYQTSAGAAPTNLEALGYDAIGFLRQAMATAGAFKGPKIKDALLSITSLEGATGITSFVAAQGPVIKPVFLKPTESGIAEVK